MLGAAAAILKPLGEKSLREVAYSKDYDVGCSVVSLEVVDLKTLDDCVCDWSEKADVGIWTLWFVL